MSLHMISGTSEFNDPEGKHGSKVQLPLLRQVILFNCLLKDRDFILLCFIMNVVI